MFGRTHAALKNAKLRNEPNPKNEHLQPGFENRNHRVIRSLSSLPRGPQFAFPCYDETSEYLLGLPPAHASMNMYRPVPRVPDFPAMERDLLRFCEENDIFQKLRD